ncbi:MAG: hypothetical protein IPL32_15815 [Chloracidobacterium sp.]|nr:hypothetical protein [Chloracidobacterium sp.]
MPVSKKEKDGKEGSAAAGAVAGEGHFEAVESKDKAVAVDLLKGRS